MEKQANNAFNLQQHIIYLNPIIANWNQLQRTRFPQIFFPLYYVAYMRALLVHS